MMVISMIDGIVDNVRKAMMSKNCCARAETFTTGTRAERTCNML